MKLKPSNVIILLSLTLVCFFILSGCAQDQTPTKNPAVTEIRDQISESIDISQMRPGNAEVLTRLYKVNMEDIEEFVVYTAPSNLQADELTIIKVKDSSKVEEVKNKLTQRVEDQASSFKDYLPEEYALIEKHVLKSSGNYVLLSISDKADEIEKIFDNSLK